MGNADSDGLLVGILANSDAVWLPIRDFSARWGQNAYAARQGFEAAGVPIPQGGRSGAARQAQGRLLADLAAEGLAARVRPKHVNVLAARLTAAGEALARVLVGLPGLADGLALVEEVHRLAGDGWCIETALTDCQYGDSEAGRALAQVEDLALPALSRGWLESNADQQGHVYYRVTPTGRAVLDDPPYLPDGPDVPADPEARALYLDTLRAALDRLKTMQPADSREIGIMPLPCAMGGAT